MKTEPALIIGSVQAVIALVVAFGLNLSADQTAAIMGIAAIVAALITRQHVTPAP